MNRNYNQYDDNDYVFYDTNDDSLYSDDLVYEENDSDFESTEPVEYSSYDYEDDNYDDIGEEEVQEQNIILKNRTKILTGIIILMVLFLAGWLTPQFLNRKPTKTSKISLTKTANLNNDIERLKQAALKYYQKNNTPTKVGKTEKLTLNEIIDKKVIKDFNSIYSKEKTYIKLTKKENYYLLEIHLVSKKETKNKKYYLNNYTYCTSTYLCEKESTLKTNSVDNGDNKEVESVQLDDSDSEDNDTKLYDYEYSKTTNGQMSNWSSWSKYEKTSCHVSPIVCDKNDYNCLSETKIYTRKEKLGNITKNYTTTRNSYQYSGLENKKGCASHQYVKVNGIYYRTLPSNNFTDISKLSSSSPASHGAWIYMGRKASQTPPNDSLTDRYVFVGSETSCENCQSQPTYTYDLYHFDKRLERVDNLENECGNYANNKRIPVYNITMQTISVNRTEATYGTVCYKSSRTREITKKGDVKTVWSSYGDDKLLNDGYTYTGKKKER